MPSTSEMYAQAQHFSQLIDAGIASLRDFAQKYADAEAAYRQGKAEAWVRCPRDEAGERDWTAARREAWVDAQTAELRRERDLAEAMKQAALEAVRSRRAQLSSVQTFANAERAEMELAR